MHTNISFDRDPLYDILIYIYTCHKCHDIPICHFFKIEIPHISTSQFTSFQPCHDDRCQAQLGEWATYGAQSGAELQWLMVYRNGY